MVGTVRWNRDGLYVDMTSTRSPATIEYVIRSFSVREGCSPERAGEILRDEIRRLWQEWLHADHRSGRTRPTP